MIKEDVQSNAQSWELEVICKNKKYLDAVISAILKYGMMNFEVNIIDYHSYHDESFDGRYTVLIWCSWFRNLSSLTTDLENIEKELD